MGMIDGKGVREGVSWATGGKGDKDRWEKVSEG
jgi:hypothetical protein